MSSVLYAHKTLLSLEQPNVKKQSRRLKMLIVGLKMDRVVLIPLINRVRIFIVITQKEMISCKVNSWYNSI